MWRAHHGDGWLRNTQPKFGLILFFLTLSKSCRYLKSHCLPSNCFWLYLSLCLFLSLSLLFACGMGIKQPEEDMHFDKANCLLQIWEVTLKEIKNTKYFDIFFSLSLSFSHVYIHTLLFRSYVVALDIFHPWKWFLTLGF